MASGSADNPEMTIEFCGEIYEVNPARPFTIGREGDLCVDENPYLHRKFLVVHWDGSFYWLANVGSRLAASLASVDGTMEAQLAPGAEFPLVVSHLILRFVAGASLYEISLLLNDPPLRPVALYESTGPGTTVGLVRLTPEQKALIVALAEPALNDGTSGITRIPSSSAAAARLGWTETKFNRKLDNVCEKLSSAGVQGMKGSATELASSRRARLVEYATAVQLVTKQDLELIRSP